MAKIFKFESLATLEGEGIRCAVFFEGCPLRCAYCHNPESWAKSINNDMSVDQVFFKIKRYKPYFGKKGGVTFTGGEPLIQAKFINEVFYTRLKDENIPYVLDTSGNLSLNDDIKECIKNCQLVILDLKFWDEDSYFKYTKGKLSLVLEMLNYIQSINKECWIRTVIVPNINDNYETLDKYIDIVKKYDCVSKYELLAFHTMGFSKYEDLKIDNPLKGKKSLDSVALKDYQDYVNKKLCI